MSKGYPEERERDDDGMQKKAFEGGNRSIHGPWKPHKRMKRGDVSESGNESEVMKKNQDDCILTLLGVLSIMSTQALYAWVYVKIIILMTISGSSEAWV